MDAAARFRTAVEDGDVEAAVALFAADAVFHSPIAHRPSVGREPLRAVLTAVLQVFSDFRYAAEYGGPDGHVLEFRARVGDRECQGVDILRGDGDLLTELTVLVRPYSAATALRERMAALIGPPPG